MTLDINSSTRTELQLAETELIEPPVANGGPPGSLKRSHIFVLAGILEVETAFQSIVDRAYVQQPAADGSARNEPGHNVGLAHSLTAEPHGGGLQGSAGRSRGCSAWLTRGS